MRATQRSGQAEVRRRNRKRRPRRRASSVVVCAAAAVLLALSVGSVDAVAGPVQADPPSGSLVLEQSLDGQTTCVSPDATCSVVNLYAQDGDPSPPPIDRGAQRTTTVQLRNAGSVTASGLDLSPAACRNQPLHGGTAGADLCATVTVAVDCATGGSPFSLGPQTLTSFGQEGTRTVTAGLAPGASATCRFTVAYPLDAPLITEALRAVQPVTWTLTAGETPPPSDGVAPGPSTPGRGPLALTGVDVLPLVLAGVALLAAGGLALRWSRRRRGDAAGSLPPA